MTDGQKLIAQLDIDRPGWYYAWANHENLLCMAQARDNHQRELAKLRVKESIINRLWPIFQAALSAGLISVRLECGDAQPPNVSM